jgi:hypothetical protein
MIAWVSACLLSSAASASSATATLTTTTPTATHVALKSRAEVFLGVSPKSVELLDASPANATRYYDGSFEVALECIVAPNRPVHIDIGGEGRYPNAINVNPNTTTSTTGTAGRTIPNRVAGRGEGLPFGARHADGISLENAPITAQTAAEIARVIKPGGSIRLVSPSDYAAAAHKRVIDSISGCNVQQSTVNGITTTTITVPR